MLQTSQDVLLCKASVAPEPVTFPVSETVSKVASPIRSWLVASPALALGSW